MANKFRDKEQEEAETATVAEKPAASKKRKPAKKGVLAKGLSSLFSGSFLVSDRVLGHLPFVLFLAVIAVFYIANGYYADDKVREANRLTNQLKELRSEYISTKSELMFASKQSEVAKAASQLGLHEPVVPPKKIVTDSLSLYGRNVEK